MISFCSHQLTSSYHWLFLVVKKRSWNNKKVPHLLIEWWHSDTSKKILFSKQRKFHKFHLYSLLTALLFEFWKKVLLETNNLYKYTSVMKSYFWNRKLEGIISIDLINGYHLWCWEIQKSSEILVILKVNAIKWPFWNRKCVSWFFSLSVITSPTSFNIIVPRIIQTKWMVLGTGIFRFLVY